MKRREKHTQMKKKQRWVLENQIEKKRGRRFWDEIEEGGIGKERGKTKMNRKRVLIYGFEKGGKTQKLPKIGPFRFRTKRAKRKNLRGKEKKETRKMIMGS